MIGWFIAPYKRTPGPDSPGRYCAMNDANAVILADGGEWTETEVLHSAIPAVGGSAGKAIVKVRASVATLNDLASVYRRIPKSALDDPLADLTGPQRTALRNELEDCGYTLAEIQARFGNRIQDFTLRDVLLFAASRRLKPRYDAANDRIICDGIIHPCRELTDVDRRGFGDADQARLVALRDTLMAEWDVTQQTIRVTQRLPNLPKWERDALLVMVGRAGYRFDKIRPDTFPTTAVLDDFNRADSGTLGANWTVPLLSGSSDSCDIVSNQATRGTVGNSSNYWNVSTTLGPDVEVYFTIATKPADGSSVRMFARMQEPNTGAEDGYRNSVAAAAGTDTVTLARLDNAAGTTLGAAISQEFASGEKAGTEIIGSTLTAEYYTGGAWASLGTRTDSTYGSAGIIAMEIRTTATRVDDFGGGTVVTAATPHLLGLLGVGK